MPTVYNGIGTWYYGKKNKQERSGICENCGKSGMLTSYDTRLWFVIIFVPVFPLGKKHILDECPHCQQHRVAELGVWEKQKEKAIAEGLRKMAEKPEDAEVAISLHRTYLFFNQRSDAAKLLDYLKERFANNAKVQFYIGAALEFSGKDAEAIPYFQHALELSPTMKEAKRAVGLHLLETGRLDDARALLRYMEEGEDYEPAITFSLARAYQNAARHKEALELFAMMLRRAPSLGKDKNFRKAVIESERAAGTQPSCLPPMRWTSNAAAVWGVAAAALIAICVAVNWYVAQSRTIHVVNPFQQPVTVSIVDGGSVQLAPGERKTLSVSEGAHHAVVTGAVQQEFDFTVESGFHDRYFGKTMRAIVPDGAGMLLRETAVYSAAPVKEDNTFQLYYGKSFVEILEVDFPFEEFPQKIKLDNKRARAYRTRVEFLNHPPSDIVIGLMLQDKRAEAFNLAEWQLRRNPGDTSLLRGYIAYAVSTNSQPRAKGYMTENCKRRPVEVEWHRAYQDLRQNSEEGAALTSEYAALLKTEPNNPTCLYLYSRVCNSRKEAMELLQRALDKDPKNAFAWLAMSHHHKTVADWKAAKEALAHACALQPDSEEFAKMQFEVNLVAGDLDALEKEARKDVAAKQFTVTPVERLCEVLVAQNRADAAKKECDECEQRMRKHYTHDLTSVLARMRGGMLYQTGQFAELERLMAGKQTFTHRLQFAALVELGKLADAEKLPAPAPPEVPDPSEKLALSIAWSHAGNKAKAEACLAAALTEFAKSGRDGARMAALLKQPAPPTVEDITELSLFPRTAAMVCAALAQRFPDRAQEYLARVRQLNVDRDFPYHLLNRVSGVQKSVGK